MTTSRSLRLVRAATLAALLLPVVAGPGRAFNIIGTPATNPSAGVLTPPTALPPAFRMRHWDLREFADCTIPYALNAAGTADSGATGGYTAMQSACDVWGLFGPTALKLTRRPNTATAACAQDGENVLWFDGNNASGFFGAAGSWSSVLGVTAIFTQNGTYRIQESDIVFNDRDWQWGTNGDDFNAVQTGNNEPFALADGDSMYVSVNGGASQIVRFTSANITVGAATRAEVRDAIQAQVAGCTAFSYPSGKVQIISNRTDGQGTIRVLPGSANAALGFPGATLQTRRADIETVCAHEFGHFLGLHHSSNNGSEPNATYTGAVMYAFAPATGSKRALTQDDRNAINFLYTPDYGDAPEGPPLHYQTLVHTATNSRMLSGVQLTQPGIGGGALFGYAPQDTLKYEWLGTSVDDSPFECEARVVNSDNFDDGLAMPVPLVRGVVNKVHVTIGYRDALAASRYFPVNPQTTLYVNVYFDFDGDRQFTAADRHIWWTGTPIGTVAASSNWTGGIITPGVIVEDFDLIPSLTAPDSGYVRVRLDLGENEGRVANYNGDLGPAVGLSQFGEVEDLPFRTVDIATPVLVARFTAEIGDDGVQLAWTTPEGGVSTLASVYRSVTGSGEEILLAEGVAPGADGGRYVDHEAQAGTGYTYRLGLFDGTRELRGPTVSVNVPPVELALGGVRPNPIGRAGSVHFSLPRAGHARLALYSVSGRLERVLADGVFRAGPQDVVWDGRDNGGRPLASGVYFLRLESGGSSKVARTVVVR